MKAPTQPGGKRGFRLWWLVVLAFLLLIVAWTSLIVVAVKSSPETIPVPAGKKSH